MFPQNVGCINLLICLATSRPTQLPLPTLNKSVCCNVWRRSVSFVDAESVSNCFVGGYLELWENQGGTLFLCFISFLWLKFLKFFEGAHELRLLPCPLCASKVITPTSFFVPMFAGVKQLWAQRRNGIYKRKLWSGTGRQFWLEYLEIKTCHKIGKKTTPNLTWPHLLNFTSLKTETWEFKLRNG